MRSVRRLAGVVGCAVLASTALASCSTAEKITTGVQVKGAVEKLGEQPSASVVASLDATPGETYEFLRAAHEAGSGSSEPTRHRAEVLARSELAFAVGSERTDTPLKDLEKSDRLDLATAMNFGGKDVVGVKTVREELYVRLNISEVTRQLGSSTERQKRAEAIRSIANELPSSLRSARDALQGDWVRVDPESFDEFARAADELVDRGDKASRKAAMRAGGAAVGKRGELAAKESAAVGQYVEKLTDVTATASSLNGESVREFVDELGKTLGHHPEFKRRAERGGQEHIEVTMPGKRAAEGLSKALRPLGSTFDPSAAPDKEITADLTIRRGQLTGVRLDLGQFIPAKGDAELPLQLDFGSGGAVPVEAPDGTRMLQPQDLLTAVMYGALGTGDL